MNTRADFLPTHSDREVFMDKELAVVVIHGMGSQVPNYAEPMIEELNSRVAGMGGNPNRVAWKPIYWADIVQPRQTEYLDNARRQGDLNCNRLRAFVVSNLGDASAYQRIGPRSSAEPSSGAATSTYLEIHQRIQESIHNLYVEQLHGADQPMVILAHSLGGHIMSNYIWDRQHANDTTDLSDFEQMETLAGIITFGCNLPLFTFAYNPVVPIRFPGNQLPDNIQERAKWVNYYDSDDVLAYPLKAINSAYDAVVEADIEINVGNLLTSWNPLSHAGYWTDDDFTIPVAEFIKSLL
jgi:hypothetical protein